MLRATSPPRRAHRSPRRLGTREPGTKRALIARVLAALAASLWSLLAAFPAAAQTEQESPARLDPVVVTVTRIEQRAGDAPADVTVLTREDISQSASQSARRSAAAGARLQPLPPLLEPRLAPDDPGRVAARDRAERGQPRARAPGRRADQRPIRRLGVLGPHSPAEHRAGGGRAGRRFERLGQLRPRRCHQRHHAEAHRARGPLRRQLRQPQYAERRRHRLGRPGAVPTHARRELLQYRRLPDREGVRSGQHRHQCDLPAQHVQWASRAGPRRPTCRSTCAATTTTRTAATARRCRTTTPRPGRSPRAGGSGRATAANGT